LQSFRNDNVLFDHATANLHHRDLSGTGYGDLRRRTT
jgi:hypothetical protein